MTNELVGVSQIFILHVTRPLHAGSGDETNSYHIWLGVEWILYAYEVQYVAIFYVKCEVVGPIKRQFDY